MKANEILNENKFEKEIDDDDPSNYPRVKAATGIPSTPGWSADNDDDDEDDPNAKLFKFEDNNEDEDDDDDDESFNRLKQLAGVNSRVTTTTKNTGGTRTTGGGTTTRTAITNKDHELVDVITSKTPSINTFEPEK